MRLHCAFLNCFNLFSLPNTAGRGETDPVRLAQKLDSQAATLCSLFPNQTPDLIGLCELGSRGMGQELGRRVAPTYRDVWAGDPDATHVSEMLLYDPAIVERTTTPVERYRPPQARRPFWLAAELQLRQGSRGVFWVVVNHWKSNLRANILIADDRRKEIAADLAEYYNTSAHISSTAMLMMGDFNCEPGDLPFRGLTRDSDQPNSLRSSREHLQVLNSRKQPAFYNPMWRVMGEPEPWDVAGHVGFVPPRHTGTYLGGGASGWKMWDQIMVTKRLLRGGPARLVESRLAVAAPVDGCSDHYAVGVALEY